MQNELQSPWISFEFLGCFASGDDGGPWCMAKQKHARSMQVNWGLALHGTRVKRKGRRLTSSKSGSTVVLLLRVCVLPTQNAPASPGKKAPSFVFLFLSFYLPRVCSPFSVS